MWQWILPLNVVGILSTLNISWCDHKKEHRSGKRSSGVLLLARVEFKTYAEEMHLLLLKEISLKSTLI